MYPINLEQALISRFIKLFHYIAYNVNNKENSSNDVDNDIFRVSEHD